MKTNWSYLKAKDFPWIKEPAVMEAIESIVSYGVNPIKKSLNSSVKVNKFLKFMYIILAKIRWKLRFFHFPLEYVIADKYLAIMKRTKTDH